MDGHVVKAPRSPAEETAVRCLQSMWLWAKKHGALGKRVSPAPNAFLYCPYKSVDSIAESKTEKTQTGGRYPKSVVCTPPHTHTHKQQNGVVVREAGSGARLLGSNPSSATYSCVTFNLLLPQFPLLPNGINNMRLSWDLVREGFGRAL